MQHALYVVFLLLVLSTPWVLFPELRLPELDGNDLSTVLLGGLLLVWTTQQYPPQ